MEFHDLNLKLLIHEEKKNALQIFIGVCIRAVKNNDKLNFQKNSYNFCFLLNTPLPPPQKKQQKQNKT